MPLHYDPYQIVPDLPCLICAKVNHGVVFCDDACRKAWQLRYELGMIDFEEKGE